MTSRQKNLITLVVLIANIYFAVATGSIISAFIAGALTWFLVEGLTD